MKGFRACHEVDQKTGLRLTLTRHNVENIDKILDFIEQENIQRVCFYHLVPVGRGSELQVLDAAESRRAVDTLIARVEEWHERGIDRELLTVTQPADGAYLLIRMERENHPNLERRAGCSAGTAAARTAPAAASPTSTPRATCTPTSSGRTSCWAT